MGAVLRLHVKLLALGVGDEVGVRHGLVEGLAQHLQLLGGQVRRGHEGATDSLACIEEGDLRLLLLGLGQIEHEGRVHMGIGLGAALEENAHLLGRQPVRPFAGHAVQGLAHAVHLAALHGEEDVGGGGEA